MWVNVNDWFFKVQRERERLVMIMATEAVRGKLHHIIVLGAFPALKSQQGVTRQEWYWSRTGPEL